MITHLVGLSLGAASSIESGVAVKEISSNKLIYVDKLFSVNDVVFFFDKRILNIFFKLYNIMIFFHVKLLNILMI